jgi:hypothetical protein
MVSKSFWWVCSFNPEKNSKLLFNYFKRQIPNFRCHSKFNFLFILLGCYPVSMETLWAAIFELIVEAGLSPREVLHVAPMFPAQALELSDRGVFGDGNEPI